MKIAICDDEAIQCVLMEKYVQSWAKEKEQVCTILSFSSADQLWFNYDEHRDMDILLLDIQMEGLNGIELAKKIRRHNEKVVIIFITGVVDYVYEGFNLSALNYLLKPIKQEQLFECLNKACEKLLKEDRYLCINVDKTIYKLNENKIMYIESINHYLNIYYDGQLYKIKMNLSEMEALLDTQLFCKTHRSYLVNLSYIRSINKLAVILDDGVSIAIARGKWGMVNQAFIGYHMGERI